MILCPECYAVNGGEEKCCTHGCSPEIVCAACGRERVSEDPYWSCTGGNPDSPEAHETAKIKDCARCAPDPCKGHPLILRSKPQRWTMIL